MRFPYNIRYTVYYLLFSILFAAPLEATSVKELRQKIDMLEKENFRLRQDLAMEDEGSRLLGNKLLKAYEEKVILKNEIKDKEEKIKALEEELAGVRKLMEKEIASSRKKMEKFAYLSDKNKVKTYIEILEKEKKSLQEKLAQKEKEIERADKPRAIVTKQSITTIAIGKVLSISKEFNFIIMEFGNLNIVEAGNIFSVFRGKNVIGKVEVTKIRERYVFARIIETTPGEEIKEGDTIK